MKLNTDGPVVGSMGVAGCGGVARDDHGGWVAGFSRRIGLTNSFVAELWGLRDGLLMCWNLNIHSLIVELDAKAIVDVLEKSQYVNNVISLILDDCRLLASCFHHIRLQHYYRQANWCAGSLARLSASQDLDFILYDSPPVDIVNAFENDLNGIYCNRFCPKSLVVSYFVLMNRHLSKKKFKQVELIKAQSSRAYPSGTLGNSRGSP